MTVHVTGNEAAAMPREFQLNIHSGFAPMQLFSESAQGKWRSRALKRPGFMMPAFPALRWGNSLTIKSFRNLFLQGRVAINPLFGVSAFITD